MTKRLCIAWPSERMAPSNSVSRKVRMSAKITKEKKKQLVIVGLRTTQRITSIVVLKTIKSATAKPT